MFKTACHTRPLEMYFHVSESNLRGKLRWSDATKWGCPPSQGRENVAFGARKNNF